MRKDKIQIVMEIAETVAQRSPDAQTKVGAVLVRNENWAHIATGFNGFVRGAQDDELPVMRPDKYPYMIHAEENIIAHCAREGISMKDSFMVCTLTPCVHCMRLLWQAGITKVIAKKRYSDWEDILFMTDLEVEAIEDGKYLELRYEAPNDS